MHVMNHAARPLYHNSEDFATYLGFTVGTVRCSQVGGGTPGADMTGAKPLFREIQERGGLRGARNAWWSQGSDWCARAAVGLVTQTRGPTFCDDLQ